MNLLKLPQVKARTKKSTAGIYADMRLGVFPKNFKVGSRAVAWLDHEIDAYIQALAAGTTQREIEILVREMLDRRESISIGPRSTERKSRLNAPLGQSEGD